MNTIDVREKELTGHNTDVIGFERSLQPLLKEHHQKALVLGTGGASLAVHHVLSKLKIDALSVSRTPSSPDEYSYERLSRAIVAEYPLIINTTPLGMHPHTGQCPSLPYEAIGSDHLLYDLVYNPEKTLFLQKGEVQGAMIKNGLEMLEQQAEAAWEIWNRGHR